MPENNSQLTLQVGVKILLKNPEGKYLLLKRSPEKYKNIIGTWDIPGGRINVGSPLIENLRREVQEETQLHITSEPRLIFAQDIMRGEKHVVRLTFTGTTQGDPVLDTTESIDFVWLTPEELRGHDDLDMYVKEMLEKGISI